MQHSRKTGKITQSRGYTAGDEGRSVERGRHRQFTPDITEVALPLGRHAGPICNERTAANIETTDSRLAALPRLERSAYTEPAQNAAVNLERGSHTSCGRCGVGTKIHAHARTCMKPSRMADCREATLCGACGRNTVAALEDWPTSLNMSKYWVRRRRSITSFGDVPVKAEWKHEAARARAE